VERYKRKPELDKRISRGDDFAGDAWEDTAIIYDGANLQPGEIIYVVVGHDPNGSGRIERPN
jgi:hypothetical protein